MVVFITVLDYPSITDPAQKVTLLVEKPMVIFSTNLLLYVFFGVFLIILSLALHDRLKTGAPAVLRCRFRLGQALQGPIVPLIQEG
jgi:hypothetical protein